jgi:hypothetical protein
MQKNVDPNGYRFELTGEGRLKPEDYPGIEKSARRINRRFPRAKPFPGRKLRSSIHSVSRWDRSSYQWWPPEPTRMARELKKF